MWENPAMHVGEPCHMASCIMSAKQLMIPWDKVEAACVSELLKKVTNKCDILDQ